MSEPESPPVHRHEARDADVHRLAMFGLALLSLIVIGYVSTQITFHYLVGTKEFPHPTKLFTQSQMPPKPLEQEHVGTELQRYLKQQNKILDTYGWVNRKAGVVRVPIDRAMSLLLSQRLPVRPPGQITYAPSQPWTEPRGDFGPGPTGVPGPQHQ